MARRLQLNDMRGPTHLAVGQNQCFGVGAPPILVYFSGDWDVHWGVTGSLTHGHFTLLLLRRSVGCANFHVPGCVYSVFPGWQ